MFSWLIYLLLPQRDNLVESRFGLILPVEEEWVIGPAANGPAIQPAIAVVDTPERNATDLVFMLHKELEQGFVVSRQLRLHRVGQSVGVRVRRGVGRHALPHVGSLEVAG